MKKKCEKSFFPLIAHTTQLLHYDLFSCPLASCLFVCEKISIPCSYNLTFVCLTFWHWKSLRALKCGVKLNHYVHIIARFRFLYIHCIHKRWLFSMKTLSLWLLNAQKNWDTFELIFFEEFFIRFSGIFASI